MGFSYKSYDVKVPSMGKYSGNVQKYNYLDKVLDVIGLDNQKSDVEVLELGDNTLDDDSDGRDNVITKTAATIATGVFSVGEGVGIFSESLVDCGALLGTSILTPFTFIGDKIFGTNTTEEMWNGTKSFVSTEHVKSAFDYFYDNTETGQNMKNDAYGFDTVRGIGNEVGYVGGVVGLTILTCGAGTAGLGATEGATLSLSQGMGLFAGTAGFGRQTQDSWNEGASLERGLVSGLIGGAWDGAQFFTGAKIAGFAPTLSVVKNLVLRVGADMGLGALDGLVRPGINSIASGKRYGASFEENGGFKTIATQMLVAGGLSLFGEIHLRDLIQFGGVKSKIKGPIDANYRRQLIDEFQRLFRNDTGSHSLCYNYYLDFFNNTENPEAIRILSSLLEAKKANPLFSLTTSLDKCNTSFYSPSEGRINITRNVALGKRNGVGMHEAGHFLHDYRMNQLLPNDWDGVVARARAFNSNKGLSARNDFVLEALYQKSRFKKLGSDEFFRRIGIMTEWADFDQYFNYMFNQNKINISQTNSIKRYLNEIGVGESFLKNFDVVKIDDDFIRDITTLQIESYKSRVTEDLFYEQFSDYAAISDIIDALYLGTGKDIKNARLGVHNLYTHGKNYYSQNGSHFAFYEMLANYTQLKTTGSKRSITMLRQICGDELVDRLDRMYKFIR